MTARGLEVRPLTLIRKLATTERQGVDTSALCVKACLSTASIDTDGDIVEPLGLDASEHRKNPVVLWAHQSTLPPVAKAEDRDGRYTVTKASSAVHGVAYFSEHDEFSEKLFRLYDEGILRAWSVGFRPKEFDRRKSGSKPGLHVKAWQLVEYSAVGIGANPDALTVRMQKGWGLRDDHVSQMLTAALAPFTLAGRAWSPGWEYKQMDESPHETPVSGDATETTETLEKGTLTADDIRDLETKVSTVTGQLTKAETEIVTLNARVDSLTGELTKAREQLTHKSGQIQDLNAEINRLRIDNAAYRDAEQNYARAHAEFSRTFTSLTGKPLA